MINSAAPENEDRCLRLQMSAHFTASEIRFFWSCLLLPLVQGVLIVVVFRTDMKKGRNTKSLQGELPRLMGTPSSGLSTDKITNWSRTCRFLFFSFHIFDCYPRKPGFKSSCKPHEPKWGNYILLLSLRTLIISLKHGHTNVCNMCAVCCVMFSRVWLTLVLATDEPQGNCACGCRAVPAVVGLLDTLQRAFFLFQSLHVKLHCGCRHKSFVLCIYSFLWAK